MRPQSVRFESPLQAPQRQTKTRKSSPKLGILIFLVFFLISIAQEFAEVFFDPRILATLFAAFLPAILFVVIFFLVRKKRADSRESLAGGAEAGHLCESHNGIPTKRPGKASAPKQAASGELRRKTQGINDLYAAGIIDGAERAERLAALR